MQRQGDIISKNYKRFCISKTQMFEYEEWVGEIPEIQIMKVFECHF